jgi:hypothetical protein
MELAASLQVHNVMGNCKSYKNNASPLSCGKKRQASNWWQARVLPWQHFEYEHSQGGNILNMNTAQERQGCHKTSSSNNLKTSTPKKKWGGDTGGPSGAT